MRAILDHTLILSQYTDILIQYTVILIQYTVIRVSKLAICEHSASRSGCTVPMSQFGTCEKQSLSNMSQNTVNVSQSTGEMF